MLNVFGLDPIFGPLVRIIQGMVSNVASFMMLLVVFMAGFATCLKSVFMQVDPDHAGDFRLESYVDQTKSMVALLNMALGQFDLIELYDVDIMGWPPPFHSVCNQQKHSKLSNPVSGSLWF